MVLRPYHLNWGATPEELRRPMPGNEILQEAQVNSTRAIMIDAPPGDMLDFQSAIGLNDFKPISHYVKILLKYAKYQK